MSAEIQKILQMNHIHGGLLAQAIHQDIREMFLKEICTYMKSSPARSLEIRKLYFRSYDDLQTVRTIVRRVCGGALPDKDLVWLNRCIRAHLHKKGRRRQISDQERADLWSAQGGLCAICRRSVKPEGFHVDHIVPWDYVGDELPDNLQVLCPDCNWLKNDRVARALRNLFLPPKGVSS